MDYVDLGASLLGKTKYYYSVSECVTTFGQDENKSKPFSTSKEFKGELLTARSEAVKYYKERKKGAENASYHLPFASSAEFVMGENAAFSLVFYFVEHCSNGEMIFHPLLGEAEEELNESIEIEAAVLKELGYTELN